MEEKRIAARQEMAEIMKASGISLIYMDTLARAMLKAVDEGLLTDTGNTRQMLLDVFGEDQSDEAQT